MHLIALLVPIVVVSAVETTTENGGCKGPDHDCVPYYLCNTTMANEGLVNLRLEESSCESYLDVCCAKSDQIDGGDITTIGAKDQKDKMVNVDADASTAIYTTDSTTKANVGCGYRNKEGVGFRLHGLFEDNSEAQFGEFPWMAAILKRENIVGTISNVYQCGASLIHPEIVLTAAQCVFGTPVESLKVRAGEWDTQTQSELLSHQDREVVEVVIHQDFNNATLDNDIALVFLKSPLEVADNVNTICLPPVGTSFDLKKCIITGWGKNSKPGKYSVILKRADVTVVPSGECEAILRNTTSGDKFQLHSSSICGGNEAGKDICKGNEGSPLACPIEGTTDRYQQVGLFSWGSDCGDAAPNLYVGVAKLRSWLDEQLVARKVNSTYYTV